MTYEEYADLPGWNWSVLKEGRRSAKHLAHRRATQREDTIRLGKGRAGHCLVLTPDLFALDFAVWREGDRRGTQWNEFKAANKGRTIIKLDEYADCVGMRDSLLAHPVAGPVIRAQGECEKVIQWVDEATGVPCKARLDKLIQPTIFDLKTTVDADARRFGALAHRYGYAGQGAFYSMGCRKALGIEPEVKLLAVETQAPWDVAVFRMSPDDLWAGEQEVRELLSMVAAGLFSGRWPGRYETEVPLELPAYAFPEGDAAEGLVMTGGSEEAA